MDRSLKVWLNKEKLTGAGLASPAPVNFFLFKPHFFFSHVLAGVVENMTFMRCVGIDKREGIPAGLHMQLGD